MSTRSEFTQKITTLLEQMLNDGHAPVIDYAVRSTEEQQRLWSKGRQKMNDGTWVVSDPNAIVTKVDGVHIQSKHQLGLAMDIYFVVNNSIDFDYSTTEAKECLEKYHDMWTNMGGRPMISFDAPHFEL